MSIIYKKGYKLFKIYILLIFIFNNISLKGGDVFLYSPNNTSSEISENDLNTINLLFKNSLETECDCRVIESKDMKFCDTEECAKENLENIEAGLIIYTSISTLGEKIFFTGNIIDKLTSFSFNSKITVLSIEDMENGASRLAKSLILKEGIADVATIDNIIDSEGVDRNQRKSLYKFGIMTGYSYPVGNSYNGSYTYSDFSGAQKSKSYSTNSFYDIGLIRTYELQNNLLLTTEGVLKSEPDAATEIGLDLSISKYINNKDISPYFGASIGIHKVNFTRESDFDDELNEESGNKSGFNIGLQSGIHLLRTYDVNVHLRARANLLLAEKKHTSLTLNGIFTYESNKEEQRSSNSNPFTTIGQVVVGILILPLVLGVLING